MPPVIPILFGATFTIAACAGFGAALLHWLVLPFDRLETAIFAFLGGSACLTLVVFALCVSHLAAAPVLLAVGAAAILGGAIAIRRRAVPANRPAPLPKSERLPAISGHPAATGTKRAAPLPKSWLALFLLLYSALSVLYFVNALAPEASPDGSGYHLGNVYRMVQAHGFDWNYRSMYSYMPQGMEMLFLAAFPFGGHSAAAMVHLAFLAMLPVLLAAYGRRFGFPRAGLFAGILVYASPVVGLVGASAYNDLALATCIYAVFYLLEVSDEFNSSKTLLLIGLLAGYCFALKYIGGLAVVFAAGWLLAARRNLLPFAAGAAAAILPWVVRNWIWTGNPVAPFLNRWFPNPYFHPGMEASYLADLRHYPVFKHLWEIPLQMTVSGSDIPGFLGPAWLLAPLALLSLRHRHGRRLLLAAGVFAIPVALNAATRFLIPAVPFLAMSMGIALSNSWGILPLLAIFQVLLAWPSNAAAYCAPHAWRIREIPARAALRREPEAEFIRRRLPDYALKEPVERLVPPGERIFSLATRPEAYIHREIVVGYESSVGNLAQELLLRAIDPMERLNQNFTFAPASRIRLCQTATGSGPWTVAAVRLLSGGRELPPASDWHVSASPNPWEAGLAFDGNPASRWSSWQPITGHEWMEIALPPGVTADALILEADQQEARVAVEIPGPGGAWGRSIGFVSNLPPTDLRRSAALKIKEIGIRYLLIGPGDAVAEDLKQHANFWGVTPLAEANATRLYRID